MINLDNLTVVVEKLLKEIDEDFQVIKRYADKQRYLAEQQEVKIRDTAKKLLPVMRKIKENGFYFTSDNTTYMTKRGPILSHDRRNDLLYVYSVDDGIPLEIDLNNDKTSMISHDKLLKAVEFTEIMEGLLSVLSYTSSLKGKYQESIKQLEEQLTKYEEV
ncbi:hypothetical protein [Bacillus cereus]|uniref:hypothetical protein n=1 Tax=Bacillus cereus TaxID=1396 RepID=UPI00240D3B5C|nr:hypothetical protein [Bacillus cereus]MDG1570098.1 hypothetical protein [Bacillus cereus]